MKAERKERKNKNKKQSEDNVIKDVRKLFSLKEHNEVVKDRIIRHTKNLFKQKKKRLL